MDNVDTSLSLGLPVDIDVAMQEEYSSLSKLLQEFTSIPSVNKSWTFKSHDEKQKLIDFLWAPFPIEVSGGSTMVPSPSGSKLLIIRHSEDATHFEIWGPSEVKKEFVVSKTIHGSVYADGWFEGISWNSDETAMAYVAEEPNAPKPTFGKFGFKNDGAAEKDRNSWKGEGDWEENWGET